MEDASDHSVQAVLSDWVVVLEALTPDSDYGYAVELGKESPMGSAIVCGVDGGVQGNTLRGEHQRCHRGSTDRMGSDRVELQVLAPVIAMKTMEASRKTV